MSKLLQTVNRARLVKVIVWIIRTVLTILVGGLTKGNPDED